MKQYRLTPNSETAEQAKKANGQNRKIAKQILLGIDAHENSYQVGRKIDAGGIQPVQSFREEKLLAFAAKQLQLAEKVYAVYEAGPLGYVLYRKLKELGVEAMVCAPECLEGGSKRKHNKIDASKLTGQLYRLEISTLCASCGCPAPSRNNCALAVVNTINWCARAKPLAPRAAA